ncbi:MAG TPA: hypothetical protein VME69_16485 [Methylocella sp.]|nr:hypothetical protein [Methylocella sp.]
MSHLVFRTTARRDIAGISAFIERENASRAAAEAFIDQMTDYYQRLARLPGLLGRARRESGPTTEAPPSAAM